MFSVKNISVAVVGAAAIGLSVGSMAPAEAACLSPDCKTVTYQGFNYDISKLTGAFSDLQSVLTQQPWWGSSSTAAAIAGLVAGDLGTPNAGGNFAFGPYFAFANPETPNSLYTFGSVDNRTPALIGPFFSPGNRTHTYAIVTASVPIPTPALLPGLVGIGIAAWRKRRSEASDSITEKTEA